MGFITNSQLKSVQQALVDNLKNGKLVPGQSVTAKTLEPISEESGVIQDEPFVIQGTGTANGTVAVDVGSIAKQLEKQGNSVVYNELVRNSNFSNMDYWSTYHCSVSASGNTATFLATASDSQLYQTPNFINGHKYIVSANIKLTSGTTQVYLKVAGVNRVATQNNTNRQTLLYQYEATSTGTQTVAICDTRSSNWDNIQIKNVVCIDLTQWFNGNDNIPQEILDDPKKFYNYYSGSFAYNAGTLTNGTGEYLLNTHRNQWDEVAEQGSIDWTTGENTSASNRIRSKNYIKVVPNCDYYCKCDYYSSNVNLVIAEYDCNKNYLGYQNIINYESGGIPANIYRPKATTCYIRFATVAGYGGTYNDDITISLYYSSGEGYDKYYPYEAPSVYETGTEELRSAGSVRDIKIPDGTITRYVGSHTFASDDNWGVSNLGGTGYYWYRLSITPDGLSGTLNIISDTKYTPAIPASTYSQLKDLIGFYDGYLFVKDATYCVDQATANANLATFKASMVGKKIHYLLATPTTEQGTPFPENIQIDDYGTMGWLEEYDAADFSNNVYSAVPQGCKIFYPADIGLFMDTLGQREDIQWDANEIASQYQLGEYERGERIAAKASLADNLSTELGSTQEYDYLYDSPLNIGVNDGDYAKNTNIKGNSYAINQIRTTRSGSFNQTLSKWDTIGVETDKVLVYGHKYLTALNVKIENNNEIGITFTLGHPGYNQYQFVISNGFNIVIKELILAGGPATARCGFMSTSAGLAHFSYSDLTVIDLTQMFGSDDRIPADLLAHPETFYNYYQGDLSYNTGTLVDSKPTALISTNANVWDEEWENGYINASGGNVNDSTRIRSKNYIRVLPNTTYYFKNVAVSWARRAEYDKNYNLVAYETQVQNGTFTTAKNATYIRFCLDGTTYNNDICVNISDASFNGRYVSHVSHRYPLTLPVMRSAGSVQDDINKVRVGVIDLGTLSWSYVSSNGRFVTGNNAVPLAKESSNTYVNVISSKYVYHKNQQVYDSTADKYVVIDGNKQVVIRDSSYTDAATFKTSLSGVLLYYELATPTDQEEITLPENVEVFTDGVLTMEYDEQHNVPCDAEFLYQVNIKRFIEGVGARDDINWDKDDIVSQEQLQAGLATKADPDGTYPLMNAGHADTAQSLDTSLGVDDETPFSYQTAGGESDIETGMQKLEKLVGCKLVKNQHTPTQSTKSEGGITLTYNSTTKEMTASGTTTNGGASIFFVLNNSNCNLISGHKYLYSVGSLVRGGETGGVINIYIAIGGSALTYQTITTTPATNPYKIFTANASGQFNYYINWYQALGATISGKITPIVIDLTQMFGSNEIVDAIIGSDTSKQVANLLSFLGGWLPTEYDEGSFTTCKSAKLKTVDYNQWDEQWELGYFNSDGSPATSSNNVRTKNDICVLPNTTYYFKKPVGKYPNGFKVFYLDINKNVISTYGVTGNETFTTPINCAYIKFYAYSVMTAIDNDICIFLYWDGSRIGYEPYNEHPYDLPNQDLNGILVLSDGKVVADGDELYPDGTGSKKYDVIDLGTLTYTFNATWNAFSTTISTAKRITGSVKNALCPIYIQVGGHYSGDTEADMTMAINTNAHNEGICTFRNSSYSDAAAFKTAMSGVYLIYELATPQALTGTAFTENIYVDDFGTMQFLDENNNQIVGLQGNKIFYKANIAGFAESLYAKVDGDPDEFVTQSDLGDVGMNMTLLWTNTNSTNSFADQVVKLDLYQYKFVYISFKVEQYSNYTDTSILLNVQDALASYGYKPMRPKCSYYNDYGFYSRQVYVGLANYGLATEYTEINFGVAKYRTVSDMSTLNTNNAYMVPMNIYGIK